MLGTPVQGWLSPFEGQNNHCGKLFHISAVALQKRPEDYLPLNMIWKTSFPWAAQKVPALTEISVWGCFLKIYQEENGGTALGFSLCSLEIGSEMELDNSGLMEANFLLKAMQTDLLYRFCITK